MVNPFNDPFNCNETASIFFRISCHVFWVNCSSFDDNKKRTNDKQTRGWVSCQKDSEREKKKKIKKYRSGFVNQLSAICLFVLESKYNININTSSFYIHVSIVDIYCWCWLLCHFFFNTWYQRPKTHRTHRPISKRGAFSMLLQHHWCPIHSCSTAGLCFYPMF